MEDKTLCPLCGEGHMTPRTESMQTEYRDKLGAVTLRYAECDACGSEITGDADGRANKRVVLAFRKSVDGLLAGAEIRALREKFGITQEQAARLFGGGPKAFSKYEADDVAPSEAMNTLLCLVRRSEDAFWELLALKEMTAELPARRVAKHRTMDVPVIRIELTIRHEVAPDMLPAHTIPYRVPLDTMNMVKH
ncbi:MAG: type II toxin-antitoxin system MqsA family antitoxin [Candidatus Accumulibacter sp.]|uniref:Type II toxin-antitoxin system MqsA family antitoxin n=1 Tax=Candidatus Accumulibacter affinis TaxID=2954384 RepID=A0A935T832_9PROT|nr:type II toxin-antitoxin system MqsA family antitoxin [Candidatus Accumulibacter affinis]